MLAFYLSLLETDEDRALFEFYFHQHEQSVLKIVMKLLRNQAMAEDAVQNGWVNLIKNFEKFVQLSMQERDGYIVSIMKNAARNVLRQETRFVGLEERLVYKLLPTPALVREGGRWSVLGKFSGEM